MKYIPDEKDLLILDALRDHGEYTVRQIAKKTLLPATTIHNRIGRLRKAGVIKKFTIEVDQKKLGLKIGTYLLISADLNLLKKKKKTPHDVASEIRKMRGVESVDVVAGESDIIVRASAEEIEDLDKKILNRVRTLEGVSKTRTMIVIRD